MFWGLFHVPNSLQSGQQGESATLEPKHGTSLFDDRFSDARHGLPGDKEGQCVALSTHPSSCPAAALSSRQACSLRESVTNSH